MKASEHPVKNRRPLGIWGQILCGFGIFILVVAALLWLFQIVLLDPFYRAVKTTEVKATAETVQHALEASDMNEQVRQMCLNTGINIVVTDEHGQMLSGWKASEKESYLENLSRSRLKMSNLFNEVNLKGGDQLMVARSPFVNQDGTQDEVILYVTITRTPSGLNRMVLLESAITPVDSLKETLQVQVTTLTVVMAAMGVLLALFIARRISRPLADINESAKVLAKGDYAIRFGEHGAREVRELARTLNYAAGELSKVEGLRRDLLANVSHDLRTPLTMIKGYSEVMRDLPGENTPENVQIIIDEAERLTNLVNDLLDLSKSKQTAFKIAWSKLEELASIRMDELTIGRLQECVDRKAPTYYPAKDMKTVLSHLYKRAVAEGNARTNLSEFIRLPPLEEKEMQPFTEEELHKLWKAYGDGDRIIGFVLLMIYTGMMPGELAKFTPDMVNWDKGEILGCGLKTKKRKQTPIVFPAMLEPVLHHLIDSSEGNKYVVGMNRWTFYDEYHEALKRAGVRDLPPYSCRHTTATALALGNIAPSVIQEVMRHTKFSTTQRYIHPDRQAALDAVNTLGRGKIENKKDHS